MRRSPGKKGTERRKKSREPSGQEKSKRGSSSKDKRALQATSDSCHCCGKSLLGNDEKALFVEEEIGRVFCSEDGIAEYFTPDIERLEKEYFRRLSPNDLTGEEKEGLAHLRWITLQEPDEVWREKTLSGDHRYTLISEFQPGDKRVWSVCICLFLRGEPSFLYLAFTTKNAAMLNHYRRGEEVEWVKPQPQGMPRSEAPEQTEAVGDCLATDWTADETFLAQMSHERSSSDISSSDFSKYQACLEQTLEEPDEVWSSGSEREDALRIFHFIRQYPQKKHWYVVIARETEDEEQIELLDAFPTRDATLVERYRRGEMEVGPESSRQPAARVVH